MSCFVLMAVNKQMFWLLYWFWTDFYVQKKKATYDMPYCISFLVALIYNIQWYCHCNQTRLSSFQYVCPEVFCLFSHLSGPLCIIKCAYRSVLQPHCVLMFLCLVRAVNREHYDSLFVCLPVLQPVCLFIYQFIHSFIVWPVYLVFSVGRKPCCRASL